MLHFTRSALNTQTAPPNQILIGLALILTFFIMEPTITRINEEAIQPFEEGTIDQDEALEKGMAPLREFMYPQTQVKDVELFMDIAGQEWDGTLDRFYDLYTVYCDRYGSGIHLNEYGYDDAAADDDLHAFQDPAVRTGRRLGTDHRATGTDILLDS